MPKKDLFDGKYKEQLPPEQGKNFGKKDKWELKKTGSKIPIIREIEYDANEDGSKDFHHRRENGKTGSYSSYDGDDD